MNALTGSWKTSSLGILAGLGTLAHAAYQPGMTPKQWVLAIVQALVLALFGIVAQDHKAPATTGA